MLAGSIVVGLNLLARVSSARDFKALNNNTAPEYPIAIAMAYTRTNDMEKEARNALRQAERGFNDASNVKIHKALRKKIKYSKVNLNKVPAVADEYGLSKEPDIVTILIFKDGKMVTALPIRLSEATTDDEISATVQDAIDNNVGHYINTIIDEYNEHQKDLEVARAKRDTYYYRDRWGYSNPWWDYYYHGYYNPHHYPHHSGFGFYIGVD